MTKLEKLLKEKGITAHQLSLKADIRYATLHKLIKNNVNWSYFPLKVSLKIANTLNCKISDFVEDSETEILKELKKYEKIK